MAKDKNPISDRDKNAGRIAPELESDKFSEEEQKTIVDEVIRLAEDDKNSMKTWLNDKRIEIQHYDGERPTILEGISKRAWQSDRNLGLAAAVSDTFQSVLLATTWNPDSIHYIATEKNDFDNAQQKADFTRWGLSKQEANFLPELDDFIWNKVNQGFSVFKILWEVKYQWVDRRIPQKGLTATGKQKKSKIKTEEVRFERGVIKNIDNLEDILIPTFGKNIQDLHHFGLVIHITGSDLLDMAERKQIINVDEDFLKKIKDKIRDELVSKETDAEKKKIIGEQDVDDMVLEAFPFDLFEMYMPYKKGKRKEEYRFIIEPSTRTFISGKPLRKITRSGKRPFAGGPFIKLPGRLRGKSLLRLIAPIVNAFNNVFNQKTDFQYVENVPFGFHNPQEGFKKQIFELEPGVSYPVEGNAKEAVFFPNLSRSLAWADSDYQVLFELLERLTGAASFFQTQGRNVSGTATRDVIVQQNSTTRFGLWVQRIQGEMSEAITLWMNMYQDWAPKRLGERVLGEDGKQLLRDVSVEGLRGAHDARITPDVTSGSKIFQQQLFEKGVATIEGNIWMSPQINPKGNYTFWSDFLKTTGFGDPSKYMGQEPPDPKGSSKLVKDEWSRFLQGESFPPNPTDNVLEHLIGHAKQKEEKFEDLDEEYRANFEDHEFQTFVQFSEMLQKQQQEMQANKLALGMVRDTKAGISDEANVFGGQR